VGCRLGAGGADTEGRARVNPARTAVRSGGGADLGAQLVGRPLGGHDVDEHT
jgi:hypothetical protein